MDLAIPARLDYAQWKLLAKQSYCSSLAAEVDCVRFSWATTQFVSLPELVSVLCWSTKLLAHGKRVEWAFRDPRAPFDGRDDQRARARLAIGDSAFREVLAKVERLRHQAVSGSLYAGTRRKEFEKLLPGNKSVSVYVDDWLKAETAALEYMDLLGYLARYEVFERAVDAGIVLNPDARQFPRTPMGRGIKGEQCEPGEATITPCLELRSVVSPSDVANLRDEAEDEDKLREILGEYASMDLVTRGIFASVLLREPTQNVVDHSRATGAWVCTRLVPSGKGEMGEDDPPLAAFTGSAFLEIVVCDNGDGLTAGLKDTLLRDPRESVRRKYGVNSSREVPEASLVDYAFDRLSSTKRDIVKMVQLDDTGPGVAAGLYWIWNLTRSHVGALAVRTGNTSAWYDFRQSDYSVEGEDPAPCKWKPGHLCDCNPKRPCHLVVDSGDLPFPGTMLRVCLPLEHSSPARDSWRASRRGTSDSAREDGPSRPLRVHVKWMGDLAQSACPAAACSGQPWLPGLQHMAGANAARRTATDPSSDDSRRSGLLRRLREEHAALDDGEILVLDMCGAREWWTKDSVTPICQFFLEMNYSATTGRSAVVLWNIPDSVQGLFDEAIRDAAAWYLRRQELRRVALALSQDGEPTFFCGWPEAEHALKALARDPDLAFAEVWGRFLDHEEEIRFSRLVAENAHVFDSAAPERVALRPWPDDLRAEIWRRSIQWLEGLLATDARQHGVCLRPEPPVEFFRLASTGILVDRFITFAGLLCDSESCARVSWMISQVFDAIERSKHEVRWVVSVTRSTRELVRQLERDLAGRRHGRRTEFIVENTIEGLEEHGRRGTVTGPAVLLTDVISTGTLFQRVRRALPRVDCLATIAIVDTRGAHASPHEVPAPIAFPPGISCFRGADLGGVPVLALAIWPIKQADQGRMLSERIAAIDSVTVCPVRIPESTRHGAGRDVWPLLEHAQDLIRLGHFRDVGMRHYIYYASPWELLQQSTPTVPEEGQSTPMGPEKGLDIFTRAVQEDLKRRSIDPDSTAILYPAVGVGDAERIARDVQRSTGARYCCDLHREVLAGQERFATFADRGIPPEGGTAIIVAHEAVTGETLLALLDAAAVANPRQVLAYVALSRLQIHKSDFLQRLRRLETTAGGGHIAVAINPIFRLGIPAYSHGTCPVCQFRRGLMRVERHYVLGRFAKLAMEKLKDIPRESTSASTDFTFFWTCSSPIEAARLREAIELSDYDPQRSDYLHDKLLEAKNVKKGADVPGALLDLAFVVCAEPELLQAPVFASDLSGLFDAAIHVTPSVKDDACASLFGFSLQCAVERTRRSGEKPSSQIVESIWNSVRARDPLSIDLLGRAFSIVAARLHAAREAKDATTIAVCGALAAYASVDRSPPNTHATAVGGGVAKTMATLLAREVYRDVEGTSGDLAVPPPTPQSKRLYELADRTASKFWHHESQPVETWIDELLQASEQASENWAQAILGPVGELMRAFSDLVELKHLLVGFEESHKGVQVRSPGVGTYWNSPQLTQALTAFGEALTDIVQGTDQVSVLTAEGFRVTVDQLRLAWKNLHGSVMPAFDAIFPSVVQVVQDRWQRFTEISGLSESIACGLPEVLPVSRNIRAFAPRILLRRFLCVAIENLGSGAFFPPTAIPHDAFARVELEHGENDEGQPAIHIRVVDNGRFPNPDAHAGSGDGLRGVEAMAKLFDAKLAGPTRCGNLTVVELTVRHRGPRRT